MRKNKPGGAITSSDRRVVASDMRLSRSRIDVGNFAYELRADIHGSRLKAINQSHGDCDDEKAALASVIAMAGFVRVQ